MSTPDHEPWVPPPWEPPIDGTEAEHLTGALGRMRATVRWKADGLDEAGLRHRIPSSALSLGGLLLHLAMAEDYYLTTKLRGEELVEPWRSLGHDGTDEWEFTTDGGRTWKRASRKGYHVIDCVGTVCYAAGSKGRVGHN